MSATQSEHELNMSVAREFYTDEGVKSFGHVFRCMEAKFRSHPLYTIDVVKPIFHYTLYNEKVHTLEYACEHGKLDLVKYLVSIGKDIRADNDLAVQTAIKHNHIEIVDYLVSLGADPHASDNHTAHRAVQWAVRNGHLEVARYLISVEANVNFEENALSLQRALINGHLNLATWLMMM